MDIRNRPSLICGRESAGYAPLQSLSLPPLRHARGVAQQPRDSRRHGGL